jgi:hypothetical protein
VARALHQLAEVRARIGRELVAGVVKVVKVNARQADDLSLRFQGRTWRRAERLRRVPEPQDCAELSRDIMQNADSHQYGQLHRAQLCRWGPR